MDDPWKVTTRTVGITPIRHEAFHVRFSSFNDTWSACQEEPTHRAGRTLDWINSRIASQASAWVQQIQELAPQSLPWWDELRECIEADIIPNPYETWNHPSAGAVRTHFFLAGSEWDSLVVVAISARSANPLQELESLRGQIIQRKWPSWVETQTFQCSLVICDDETSLSDEE